MFIPIKTVIFHSCLSLPEGNWTMTSGPTANPSSSRNAVVEKPFVPLAPQPIQKCPKISKHVQKCPKCVFGLSHKTLCKLQMFVRFPASHGGIPNHQSSLGDCRRMTHINQGNRVPFVVICYIYSYRKLLFIDDVSIENGDFP